MEEMPKAKHDKIDSMKWVLGFFFGFLFGIIGTYYWLSPKDGSIAAPLIFPSERPLDAYTIENLGRRSYPPSKIIFDEPISTTSGYTAYLFHYTSDGKKVTGLANIPQSSRPENGYPVIIQLRGFVPRETYKTGVGTERSGRVFAEHGFITLAPDFLGYGGSDNPSRDVFEERFQTYTVAATLVESVGSIPEADPARIALWGHSNGGHIALTLLAILQKPFPTVLWAPVTKPFPYSILYYTDEATDSGKLLRSALASFEKLYDTDAYSMTNYLDRITAPIAVHQGTVDDAVPQEWSGQFVALLQKKHKDVTYFVYSGADHNLTNPQTNSWSIAIERSVEFYQKHL